MSVDHADASTSADERPGHGRSGFFYALGAYLLWGFFPFYWKAATHIGPFELMAHRTVWAVPFAALWLLAAGRLGGVWWVFTEWRKLAVLAVTALLIAVNWGIFVWAVAAERTIEAALGYYINPLLAVALGAIFLGERFTRGQQVAIVLAALAVLLLTVMGGKLPWVALVLAFSFAAYGFLRKTVEVGPVQGFFVEVLLLSVPAVAWIGWLAISGGGALGASTADTLLLIGCGPVSAVPLILFAFGAKRLRLSTVGLMQYIAPTLIFLIGIFAFREPFSVWHLVAFSLIWTALAIYAVSALRPSQPISMG